jgi:uncharacterized protein (TIGR01244 family)
LELKSLDIKNLTDKVSAIGQINVSDIAKIKQLGFTTLICNRPDGEAEGQPDNDEIEMVATQQGISYHYIPVATRDVISEQMIAKTKAVLENANEPVLCFCRTGTRSTFLWAYALSGIMDKDKIISNAKKAGYDISSISHSLE